ncbi:MAG TPA: mechanosensitive ion channel protein MscS [Pseudohongiella sp.]|nr:mechanosensitive ion channel protein MscS [Pseudohongiella sp.]HBX38850.1 mechanosensitive ion channel protein MscS [Pseudohongiella sp.]|tara:strand:+ start:3198 stop:4034 length:837 start_codon:yes stop_codon:yes gene_type:complete
MESLENLNFSTDVFMGYALTYGPRIVGALATLVLGLWVVSILVSLVKRLLKRSKVDPSLASFLSSLMSILLKVLVYITALGVLGVQMTSFIAILGAAGLAIGLALSGTLQNFAGGVMILFFKYFKVGDFIEAQGHMGTVREIQIFVTELTTPDNKTIFVPNGPLSTGSLINYSAQPTRRVDWTFGIAYGDDVDTAYGVLGRLIEADDRILKDPAPFMAVSALADSSVNIVVRVWVNAADFWGVHFRMNELVYKEFDKAGLSIPFPQRDIYVHQVPPSE